MAGPKFRGLMRKVTNTQGRQSSGRSGKNDRLSTQSNKNISYVPEDRVTDVVGVGGEQSYEGEVGAQSYTCDDRVVDMVGVRGGQSFEQEVGVQEGNNAPEIEDRVEGAETENIVDKRKYIPIEGYDTPIDPLTQKRPLEWKGTQFKNKSASRLIGSIWDLRFTEPWYKFSKVPQEKKIVLFNEFKKAYTYDIVYEHKVYEIWKKSAASILKKKLNRARIKAKKLRQTTTMINCRDTPPEWIQATIWNQMIDIEWHKSKYDNKCKKMRANHLTPKEGTHTRHTAGSVSIVSHDAQVELVTGKPVSFQESFMNWHTKREKAKEKGKAMVGSATSNNFIDNKSQKVYETYMEKKAELQEDESVWNPQLWIESCGGLTRGRVYGAPYLDTSTIQQRNSQSNFSADCANQGYIGQPTMSTGMTLTSEIKSIIEKEVRLAITSLYGSTSPSNLQSTNQQPWAFSQLPGQIPQPSGQGFLQPSSQISQPPTQMLLQPPSLVLQAPSQIPQQCDPPFLQIPNHILQPSGHPSQPHYQFAQPSTHHQTLEQYQSMNVPPQPTIGNIPQQVGSFMQLLRPTIQDQLDQNQLGNIQASNHHENRLSENEDDT